MLEDLGLLLEGEIRGQILYLARSLLLEVVEAVGMPRTEVAETADLGVVVLLLLRNNLAAQATPLQ